MNASKKDIMDIAFGGMRGGGMKSPEPEAAESEEPGAGMTCPKCGARFEVVEEEAAPEEAAEAAGE